MIDSLTTWKSELALLPLVEDVTAGVTNFAAYIADRVDGKLALASPVIQPVDYTWDQATFISELSDLVAGGDAAAAYANLAAAWKSATQSATISAIGSGHILPPTPATTWSSPPTITIFIASLDSAASQLESDLNAAPLVSDPQDSAIPAAFLTAFQTLQFTVSGLDSTSPPAGPLPLSTVASVE